MVKNLTEQWWSLTHIQYQSGPEYSSSCRSLKFSSHFSDPVIYLHGTITRNKCNLFLFSQYHSKVCFSEGRPGTACIGTTWGTWGKCRVLELTKIKEIRISGRSAWESAFSPSTWLFLGTLKFHKYSSLWISNQSMWFISIHLVCVLWGCGEVDSS